MKETKKNEMLKLFWIFVIGCLAGFIIEGVVTLISRGHFEIRQGVIYGPFAQVYGIGTLAFYLLLPKIKGNTKIVIVSMTIGAIVEYGCSYLQQMWFGTVSWDYTNQILNLNGRTSLFYALCWGILGLFFSKKLYPLFNKLDFIINRKLVQYTTYLAIIFMLFNFSISFLAGARQKERMENQIANTKIEVFLDKHYPDYRMNRIYGNKIRKVSTDSYF